MIAKLEKGGLYSISYDGNLNMPDEVVKVMNFTSLELASSANPNLEDLFEKRFKDKMSIAAYFSLKISANSNRQLAICMIVNDVNNSNVEPTLDTIIPVPLSVVNLKNTFEFITCEYITATVKYPVFIQNSKEVTLAKDFELNDYKQAIKNDLARIAGLPDKYSVNIEVKVEKKNADVVMSLHNDAVTDITNHKDALQIESAAREKVLHEINVVRENHAATMAKHGKYFERMLNTIKTEVHSVPNTATVDMYHKYLEYLESNHGKTYTDFINSRTATTQSN